MEKNSYFWLLFVFLNISVCYSQSQDVNWSNLVNTTASGGTLTKMNITGWNGGAISTATLAGGADGWVEFDYVSGISYAVGLADTNPDAGPNFIDYAIYCQPGYLIVWENGVHIQQYAGTPIAGDKLKVERIGNTIYYKRNNLTFYTSLVLSQTAIFVDVCMFTPNGSITGSKINFSPPPAAPGIWQQDGSSIFYNSGNVGIGTTAPDSKLAVKGSIHTQEVKVDLLGAVAPDYVFEKGYPLTSLEELEAYIEQHKHLPEIPSAKEMEEDGIKLKEMNLLLLRKVEEMTIYLIELKRVNDYQQKQIDYLTTTRK
jgi:Phage T4 tail fibre